MDRIVYNTLSNYFHALEQIGYISSKDSQKALILSFYRDFVYCDYRGLLNKDDYRLIEKALDCLYGSTCLIPYPDYLKMGKLHIGEMTEMAQRVKTLEDTDVVKVIHSDESDKNEQPQMLLMTDEDN